MLNLKRGFPEEGDILMCTVSKVHFHSVFVSLDEYERKQGLIHISEISPGRIRNINDYVQEGKKIICKVLSINREKGHIDLSLRRVSNIQKRNKVEAIKQEQKAEKILEFVAKEHDMKQRELNSKIAPLLLKEYDSLHSAFEDISYDNITLDDYNIDKKLAASLTEIIKQRIRPPVMQISGVFELLSYDSNGVDVVKNIIIDALEKTEGVELVYNGGGKYSVVVTKNDYKSAEIELKNLVDAIEKAAKDKKCEFEFNRKESKKIKA